MSAAGRGRGTVRGTAPAGRGRGDVALESNPLTGGLDALTGATPAVSEEPAAKKGAASKLSKTAEARLSCYSLDISDLRFDVEESMVGAEVEGSDSGAAQFLTMRKKVDKVDDSMFGDFTINVDSEAKEGTELGFEFKAILDKDFEAFSADDFEVSISATDIALSGVSVCADCNKSIKDPKNGVSVFGKAYHRNHLSCAHCKENFMKGGEAMEGPDNQAYCLPHWEERFLKRCGGCSQLIREKNPLNAMKRFWHKPCFKCGTCDKLISGRYYEENGKPMCAEDYYKKKGLVCPACEKYVEGEPLVVGKYKFHKSHYRCNYCRRTPDGFFKKVDNKPGRIYCTECHARIYESHDK